MQRRRPPALDAKGDGLDAIRVDPSAPPSTPTGTAASCGKKFGDFVHLLKVREFLSVSIAST
jgi:hypothetical protein